MSPDSDLPAHPADLASPWDELDADGTGLTVDDFLTTRISQTINVLRRVVTLPYAQAAGLSVSEWRLLSYVAFARRIPFSELVVLSTSDKALVSRVVRQLEQRGLVATEAHGSTPRKKLTVVITDVGDELHEKVIPIARRSQAEMIRVMTVDERRGMYNGLQKLLAHALAKGPLGTESGTGSDA